jgi:hypothetical protein
MAARWLLLADHERANDAGKANRRGGMSIAAAPRAVQAHCDRFVPRASIVLSAFAGALGFNARFLFLRMRKSARLIDERRD